MALYKPLSGETIFDIAVKLYGGDFSLGMTDLLENNDIDISDTDLFGTDLTYTVGLTRIKPVYILPEVAKVTVYKTRFKQSIYDLTIQLYGDLSKIGNLTEFFSNLDNNLTVNTEIELPVQDDPIAEFFRDRQIIVSTDVDNPAVTDYRLLESGDIRILESGDYRLLE
jgi:hypothetical protein